MYLSDSGIDPVTGMSFGAPVRNAQMARFYEKAEEIHDPETGEKKTIIKEMVFVGMPGAKSSYDGVVTDQLIADFPSQYAAFKAKAAQVVEGTPIGLWPYLTAAQAEDLTFKRVATIEQLAALPDPECARLGMGAKDLREKAKAYLADKKGAGLLAKLQDEKEELKAQLEEQRQMVQTLAAKVEGLSNKDKKAKA